MGSGESSVLNFISFVEWSLLTFVSDFEVVEDMVIGGPSCASREEHLAPFEVDDHLLIDDLSAIVEDPDGAIEHIDSDLVWLIVFNGRGLKPNHVIAGVGIFGQCNVTCGGGVGVQFVGSIVGVVPGVNFNGEGISIPAAVGAAKSVCQATS